MSEASTVSFEQLRQTPVAQLREIIRSGQYTSHTGGLGAGKLQANLAILPEKYALDFMRFCQRNPKPCPLVGCSETGDPMMHTLGDIDIRTDIPSYNIYRDGKLDSSVPDITDLWRDDFVAFALGCSYTFEDALSAAGIPMHHVDNNKTVAMYRTTIETSRAGPFGGGTVVSMRPIKAGDVAAVERMCRQFPLAHGAPVHIGDPSAIGVSDVMKPDWGDQPDMGEGEVPVFWACGVTPQNAIMLAGLPICITHTPGRMLITDVPEDAEVPVLMAA